MVYKMVATFVFGLVMASSADLTFIASPTLTTDGQNRHWVEFTLSGATDVAVCVVRLSDSAVVRHLAAGVLGANPPAPLQRDSLHQRIEWDGNDDAGRAVDASGGVAAWVRAGMSPALDNVVDHDIHGRSPSYTWTGMPLGLFLDSTGSLFVLGRTGMSAPWYNGMLTLRAFDGATGLYQRTLLPIRAGLSNPEVVPYSVVLTGSGGYHPKTVFNAFPVYQVGDFDGDHDIRANPTSPLLVAGFSNGNITMVNYPGMFQNGPSYVQITGSGACLASARAALVQTPAMPAYSEIGGVMSITPFPGGHYALMSGVYRLGTDTLPVDTGFWRDGRVYKVDVETGTATAFISLRSDSLPSTVAARRALVGPGAGPMGHYGAVQGITADDSGHVFVCDRFHGQIGVYDTAGVFIKSVPVPKPDQVAVNSLTGELYVVSRECAAGTGCCDRYMAYADVRLRKFTDWRASPSVQDSLLLDAVSNMDAGILNQKIYMALNTLTAAPVVWLVLPGRNVIGIRDDNGLVRFKDFADSANYALFNFDRAVVDRKSETVYIQNSMATLHKIEDWSNPRLVACSTTTVQSPNPGRQLLAGDVCVSPDGYLYARLSNGSSMNSGWNGPISRFTLDHLHAPAPFGNRGDTNIIVPQADFHNRYGAGFADRGFDVTMDGSRLVYYNERAGDDAGGLGVQMVDTLGARLNDSVVDGGDGAVKLDNQGNLYVGGLMRPSNHLTAPGYETDSAYLMGVGSVVKFSVENGGLVQNSGCCGSVGGLDAPGSLKIYEQAGFGSFSGHYPYYCACRVPRFDLDRFGRLFIPNSVTGQVAVLDNEGNLISRFGEYGNQDSWGPASPVPTAGIPLSCPASAAASENHIYVADMVNERLVKVDMNYSLDNMPWLPDLAADHGRGVLQYAPTMTAAPNPFNPEVRITLAGFHVNGVSLKVFDLSGRQVADLSKNLKAGAIIWNATGHASGVYIVEARQGGLSVRNKVIYSK